MYMIRLEQNRIYSFQDLFLECTDFKSLYPILFLDCMLLECMFNVLRAVSGGFFLTNINDRMITLIHYISSAMLVQLIITKYKKP